MADESQRAYFATVEAIVEEAREAEEEGGDVEEFIHESVDGSEWIIYTHKAMKVLQYSDNDNALFDEVGVEGLKGVRSFSDVVTRLAYFAMVQDVYDRLNVKDYDEDRFDVSE